MRVEIKLHEIIGFVIHWPVIMSNLVCTSFKWDFYVFKFVIIWELITESHALASWRKAHCIHYNVRTAVDTMSI